MRYTKTSGITGIFRNQFLLPRCYWRCLPAWLILFFAVLYTHGHAAGDIFQILIPAPSDPDASRGLVYSDVHDHIVMEYDLGRIVNDKVYFTDGHPLFHLTDGESYALANTPSLLGKFATAHGLTPLEFALGKARFGAASLEPVVIDGPQCQWPYNVKLDIGRTNKSTLEVMFFRRRPTQKRDRYQLSCERGPGETELTTQFESLSLTIFIGPKRQPIIAFRQPPIVLRFDSDGSTINLRGNDGVFAVPAVFVEHVYAMVAEGEIQPQDAIKMLETKLDIADVKAK